MKNTKKIINIIIIVTIALFYRIIYVGAVDYSNPGTGGGPAQIGKLGSGDWYPSYVGLKVSIVDKNGNYVTSKIILNSKGGENLYYSTDIRPKTKQNNPVYWDTKVAYDIYNDLPNYWCIGGSCNSTYTSINIKEILQAGDFSLLKKIISNSFKDYTPRGDDYILVEPMMRIKKYYGTAYELTNSFMNFSFAEGTFCWHYNGPLFGGNSKMVNGGIFYNTIYLEKNFSNLGLSARTAGNSGVIERTRINFMLRNGGAGIGVFKISDLYPYGTLELSKVNTSNSIINSIASFNLYNGGTCSASSFKQTIEMYGTKSISLPAGTYSIKEKDAPTGYEADYTCRQFTISSGNTTTISIENKQTCKSEFNALSDADKKNLIVRTNLYNKYLNKKEEYRNLLNLNEMSNPCSNPTSCNTNIEVGCLGAKDSTYIPFDQNNLSCYTEKITVMDNSGKTDIGFCRASLPKGIIPQIGGYKQRYHFGSNFKSGQMVLNRSLQNRKIAEGLIIKDCFIIDIDRNGIGDTISSEENPTFKSYITSYKLNNEELESQIEPASWQNNGTSNNIKHIQKWMEASYNLNPVYSMNGSGKLTNTLCSTCKFLGYGFASNLNLKDGESYVVPFSMEINSNALGANVTTIENACTYGVKKEIIDTPDDKTKNEKVNLEFRIIDTSNPFPGKNGLGRKVGTNWCDSDNCNVTNNNVVKENITDANNSYDKNKTGSTYTITLTPETIKNIREYNKSHSYDDYTLRCEGEDGTNCKSTFLESFNIKKK